MTMNPMASRSNIPEVIVIIGALVLLTPASILYLLGMSLAISLALLYLPLDPMFSLLVFFPITILLILSGYGLLSLWWLVFKFSTITFSKIPLFIHGGMISGAITSLLFLSPNGPFAIPDSNFYPLIGGGPLILLLLIILLLRIRKENEN